MLSEVERRKKRVAIAIPSSFVSDTPHLREKTARVGLVARAAAIFRVDEILIYPPTLRANSEDARFLKRILSYLETPQYLRKRIFPLSPEMKYVGVLPPLRTPHHPLVEDRRNGSVAYREGLVIDSEGNWIIVDIGRSKNVRLRASGMRVGDRITIKIEGTKEGERFSVVSRDNVLAYWGYNVSLCATTLGEILRQKRNELIVITSKYGKPILEEMSNLERRVEEASRILVVLGSPQEGVGEILARERLRPTDLSDVVLNTIPGQGTETVRTEEALYATMAILNVIRAKHESKHRTSSEEAYTRGK